MPLALRALCLATALAVARVYAAPPLPPLLPAQQVALDVAVLHYESGRFAQARRALQVLARQGVPAAQYNLAVMHLRRELPHPSRAQAAALLERAARGGFVTAQWMLGQALENGALGPRDLVRAHEWHAQAAAHGDVAAPEKLKELATRAATAPP